jgi:hypothetical protein
MSRTEELARTWAATATPAELADVERHAVTYTRLHSTGMFTTAEMRGMWTMYASRGDGLSAAHAVAISTAVSVAPYGSQSLWARTHRK